MTRLPEGTNSQRQAHAQRPRSGRTRVLVVQPSLQPPGGGNGLAAWMVQALDRDCDVTVYTWRPFEAASVDRFWGTSLAAMPIEARAAPSWLRGLVEAVPLPLHLLKSSILLRLAQRVMPRYDLVMSANNEVDFGRPGIQYIHYPTYQRPRPSVDVRWYHSLPLVLRIYYGICDRFFDVSSDAVNRNITLTNSDWTAAQYRKTHGGAPRTLYPPVAGTFPEVPWSSRRNAFVSVGRFVPEKDFDTVLDVVAAVRAVHPDVHLHVVGSHEKSSYHDRIIRRIRDGADWITLHHDLSSDALRRLLSSSRYGLHAMEAEHFGMAPAEMAAAGCIVWVRDDGGQLEIVDGDQRLVYHSREEAVARILAVMADQEAQAALRAMLAARVARFSADHFMTGVRGAVAELLAGQDRPAATTIREEGRIAG